MKNNFKIFFIVLLVIMLTACGSKATPTSAPYQATEAQTEEPVATSAPVISAEPLSTISMEDLLMASFNTKEHPLADPNIIGNHPDELVQAKDDLVWTHLDNGYLVQFNWFSNTMSAAVKTDTTSNPQDYCQGLGTDGTDIWACSTAGDRDHKTINVVRVDTSAQSILATYEVDKLHDQLYMPFMQNQIWVLTGDGSKLVGIDVTNNQANPAIDLGIRCFQLAALDNGLYATCAVENLVIKIDPEKKEVVARQTLPAPQTLAAAKNGIWVSQGNSLTRLDPETLSIIATITGITGSDISASEYAVWVWEFNKGLLYKIDPSTNEVAVLVKPDQPFTTGGGILVTEDSIWLSVNEDDLVLRLSKK